MHDSLVKIEHLKFAFGNTPILDISSFEIFRGERLFLAGPSGSGKTTLLSLIAGVLASQQGKIRVLEADFSKMTAHQRDRFRGEHLGYIFQMFNLIPYLSVLENVMLPCQLSSRRALRIKDDLKTHAHFLLNRLGLGKLAERRPHELSVGQQQRVAAARAFLGAPELIIADEPTSSLDVDHRSRFLELLFELADLQQSTILFVSHDQSLASLFSRQISLAVLNKALKAPPS